MLELSAVYRDKSRLSAVDCGPRDKHELTAMLELTAVYRDKHGGSAIYRRPTETRVG